MILSAMNLNSNPLDIILHLTILPLLAPLYRWLSLQVQLGPIEISVEMTMTQLWFGIIVLFNRDEMLLKYE